MDRDYSVLKWGGFIGGVVLPFILTCGAIWWFLMDQRLRDQAWFTEDVKWNARLIKGVDDLMQIQSEVTEELATQTLRMIELEAENKLILDALITMRGDVSFSLGKHEGRHDGEGVR